MKVGSSQVKKVDVRVIAATNVNIEEIIKVNLEKTCIAVKYNKHKNAILRERIEDIHLLFRKFASDFADRYHIPHSLTRKLLNCYIITLGQEILDNLKT